PSRSPAEPDRICGLKH
ncbi:hypothetical protein ECTT12B_2267, partial [Escherichia coli TT12B]